MNKGITPLNWFWRNHEAQENFLEICKLYRNFLCYMENAQEDSVGTLKGTQFSDAAVRSMYLTPPSVRCTSIISLIIIYCNIHRRLVIYSSRSDWGSSEGGDEDQPVTVRARQRDFRPGGRQVDSHPIQRFEAHSTAAGLTRWQHENIDGRVHFAGGQQL